MAQVRAQHALLTNHRTTQAPFQSPPQFGTPQFLAEDSSSSQLLRHKKKVYNYINAAVVRSN